MNREPVDTLIKATGLSRRAFAKQYGVGEQVLLRLSQGRFTKVPPSVEAAILTAFADQEETLIEVLDGHTLQAAYHEWREDSQPVGQLPDKIPAIPGRSPAQRLAVAVGSMSKLAAVLHVHDFVVRRYVNGQTYELPHSMRESMIALGWEQGANKLDEHQKRWLDGE
jgi:hypothetical protein